MTGIRILLVDDDADIRDIVGMSGQVLSRSYLYPDGYRYARGEGRPSRDEFRSMLLARATSSTTRSARPKRVSSTSR